MAGQGTSQGRLVVIEHDLLGDLRFTQLVAQFIGSIRQVRMLQEHKTQLSTFFSPKIIEGLTTQNAKEILCPAEREITVLFCDVRGFSKKAEALQGDLLTLLKSVSAALGVMAGGSSNVMVPSQTFREMRRWASGVGPASWFRVLLPPVGRHCPSIVPSDRGSSKSTACCTDSQSAWALRTGGHWLVKSERTSSQKSVCLARLSIKDRALRD